jgi:uncharacterized protein (TIGR02271 family)
MSPATESPATVVVTFEDRHRADLAVDELCRAGFREDWIRVEESPILRSDTETGRTQVIVEAKDRAEEAEVLLRRHGAADVIVPAPRDRASATTAPPIAAESRTLQLRKERLEARKQLVELGEVRVRKEVVTEYRTLEVPVQREEVVIERQAPADGAGAASELRPGEEIRIPVREEQVTVEKRPVVKEEVTVGKRVVRETERVGGEVRTEELRVEREGDVDVHDRAPEACSC